MIGSGRSMQSKLQAAEKLEEWVVGEVLPSIRKKGSYGVDPMVALNDPAIMRSLLMGYSEKVLKLEDQLEIIKPKAQALDRIATANGSLCVTAHHLQSQIAFHLFLDF